MYSTHLPKRAHHARYCLLPFICVALSLSACQCDKARASRDGEMGFLRFSYTDTLDNSDFDHAIAKNARLNISVTGTEQQRITELHSVTSDSDAVEITKSSGSPNIFMVRAKKIGRARLKIDATAVRLGRVTDYITFHVASTHEMELEHRCTSRAEAAYIQGNNIILNSTRFDRNDDPLVGQGGCSVALSRKDIQNIACDETTLTIRAPQDTGRMTIKALERDGKTPRTALTTHIVSPKLLQLELDGSDLTVDQPTTVSLIPSTKNWPVCTGIVFAVTILTPSTCAVNGDSSYAQFGEANENSFAITGKDTGECLFRVKPYDLNSGTWEFELDVFEPDDDEDDE